MQPLKRCRKAQRFDPSDTILQRRDQNLEVKMNAAVQTVIEKLSRLISSPDNMDRKNRILVYAYGCFFATFL